MAFDKLLKRKSTPAVSLELTDREREIAQLIANGLTSKQVARKLSIGVETVKTHRRRMLQKNNISNFPHLVFLMNKA